MELNEITKLVDKIYPEQINLKSFNYKKQLNPKIWEKNKIKKNVRKRLIKIAKEFVKSTDIDFIPVDISDGFLTNINSLTLRIFIGLIFD